MRHIQSKLNAYLEKLETLYADFVRDRENVPLSEKLPLVSRVRKGKEKSTSNPTHSDPGSLSNSTSANTSANASNLPGVTGVWDGTNGPHDRPPTTTTEEVGEGFHLQMTNDESDDPQIIYEEIVIDDHVEGGGDEDGGGGKVKRTKEMKKPWKKRERNKISSSKGEKDQETELKRSKT